MNKIIPILAIGILVLSGMSGVAIIKNKTNFAPILDELDQSQTIMAENILMPIGQVPYEGNLTNIQVAQSFIPTKEILTRVELFIGKNITVQYPIYISIREELTKDDLTVDEIDPSHVQTDELGWLEINLPDIVVESGHIYYIVAITHNATDNWYGWGGNNNSESYPDGCAWFSYDDGDSWTNRSCVSSSNNVESSYNRYQSIEFDEYVTWDMCFKTFGRNSLAPSPPLINGPTTARFNESQSFIITTNDPDGDDVFYQILWGDGESEEWIGPFKSDELINIDHTWVEQGIYVIVARAKDIYGYTGNWSEFEIEIPRDRQFNFFSWLYYRFPVFREILGLN
jgi:hypothetical protein